MTTETMARTGTYEGMFLVSQAAAAQFGDTLNHINELFGRANATVVAMKKWDDRRLAYEIDKQKRGVYILAYFTCPTDMVARLERDESSGRVRLGAPEQQAPAPSDDAGNDTDADDSSDEN
jgi:small subunit ribosomal protein S6